MGLFEKRRRATDLEQVDTWDGDEDAAADTMIDLARTEPVPVVSRESGSGTQPPRLERPLRPDPARADPGLRRRPGHLRRAQPPPARAPGARTPQAPRQLRPHDDQLERGEDRVDGPDGPTAVPLRRLRGRLPLGLSRHRWR